MNVLGVRVLTGSHLNMSSGLLFNINHKKKVVDKSTGVNRVCGFYFNR